jgi:hypothetical protein
MYGKEEQQELNSMLINIPSEMTKEEVMHNIYSSNCCPFCKGEVESKSFNINGDSYLFKFYEEFFVCNDCKTEYKKIGIINCCRIEITNENKQSYKKAIKKNTLYLRKEKPTKETDYGLWGEYKGRMKISTRSRDIVAYSDKKCNTRVAIWPWHDYYKPRKNCEKVMLNCVHRDVKWLEDKV